MPWGLSTRLWHCDCTIEQQKQPMPQFHFLYHLEDNGIFPNSRLPAILYRHALELPNLFKAAYVKKLFARHGWTNAWDAGIFTYSHYHSITHEVLGFYKGSTNILLGGDNGRQLRVEAGDVLIIPAGVAHRNLDQEQNVACIGAYPGGSDYDINIGKPGERPGTDQRIAAVPIPSEDPVYGIEKGLVKIWG